MNIHTDWYNDEQTIFYTKVEGKWALEDYYEGYKRAADMMNLVNHPVVMVLDVRKNNVPPSNFLSVGRFSARNRSKNLRYTVMVGAGRFTKTLMDIMKRAIPGAVRTMEYVDTIEEAFAVAAEKLAETTT